MATVEALSSGDVTKVGLIVTAALVLIGVLLSIVITAVIGRVVILVLVVAAGFIVWQQRAHVEDQLNNCDLSVSFFGFHLTAPDSVQQACVNQ
jgi:hypothetical protein